MSGVDQDVVIVRVFGSDLPTSGCGCGPGCCGTQNEDTGLVDSRSLREQARDLETTLVRYYGPATRVEYVDIFSKAMDAFPEVTKLILERGLPLPLLTMNDDPKFAGGLPLDEISAELEALGVAPVVDAD